MFLFSEIFYFKIVYKCSVFLRKKHFCVKKYFGRCIALIVQCFRLQLINSYFGLFFILQFFTKEKTEEKRDFKDVF